MRYPKSTVCRVSTCYAITVGLLFLGLSACANSATSNKAADNRTFLTPVPEETLLAFRFGSPVSSELQAVIAAQVSLGATRLRYTEAPTVVTVEQASYGEVRERIGQSKSFADDDYPADTKVWFVIFAGEWQILPPGPDATPFPLSDGCVVVIINSDDGSPLQTGGTIACGN